MEWIIIIVVLVIIAGVIIGVIQVVNEHKLKNGDKQETLSNEQSILEELKKENFQESKCLDGFLNTKIRIDEINKNITICHHGASKIYYLIPFANIRDVSIYEDGTEKKKSPIKRAFIGGAIAGDAGAIIGASTAKNERFITSYGLNIYTVDINNPLHVLPIIWRETAKTSLEYILAKNSAESAYATINAIIAQNK